LNVFSTGKKCILWENGFTREAIACTINKGVSTKLPGRNLIERANKVIANYKFALKCQKEFAGHFDCHPSGNKLEDMLLCVRRAMWVKLRGAKDGAGASKKPASEFEDKEPEDMPMEHFFTGFMAFVLFGPRGICHHRLSCLSEDGKGVLLTGCSKERKKEAQEKQAEREAGVGGHVPSCYVRGVRRIARKGLGRAHGTV